MRFLKDTAEIHLRIITCGWICLFVFMLSSVFQKWHPARGRRYQFQFAAPTVLRVLNYYRRGHLK
jgi:hypothetical protein